jgi:hypothetical protein
MTKEQFQSDAGVAFHNLQMSQITTTVNALLGSGGPTLLPSGIDVAGATVTGLAAPTSPSDAVSAGHASDNYSAPAISPKLDIGGSNTLKGLAYCYGQVQANTAAIAALSPTTASNTFNNYTGTKSFGSIYQNLSGANLYVSVAGNINLGVGHNASALGYIGATSPPTILVSANSSANGPGWASAFFLVPPNWYYEVLTHQGTDTDSLTLVGWGEWT